MLIDSIKKLWAQFTDSNSDTCEISTREFKFIHPTSLNELRGNISGLRLIIDGQDR